MKVIFFVLIVFCVLGIGGVFLQIFLSKMQNKWFGLILPVLTLCISLTAVMSIAAFRENNAVQVVTEDGQVIEEADTGTVRQPMFANKLELIGTTASVFVIYNIPTVILLLIYAACRSKIKKNAELDKMNIQDL